jgi:hypothetical protein
MTVERLATFVQKPDVHRRVLGSYRGAYALGVTQASRDQDAALSLSVASPDASSFPREIDIEGERVPIHIQTNWSAPRPL